MPIEWRLHMRNLLLITALMLSTVAAPQAQRAGGSPAAPLVRENATQKIADHVYVIPDNNVGMVPNIGIIVGSRATFVVDTGMGARNGLTVMREVQKVGPHSEVYLATTHIHPEHDLGAGAFPPTVRMIRSRDQQKEIAEQGLATAQRFAGMNAVNAELLQGAAFRNADISFDREHVVDLGGVRVRLMAMGYNHTLGDTAFFVEPDGVLFSGDVVMMAVPNVGNATIQRWLASMDLFASLRPRRIVPSHGAMGDASMITTYRTLLQTVLSRATALKREGKTLEEVVATVAAELQSTYPTAGTRLNGTIRAAYIEAP
jgi:glyoxylase-like metal-dependent hydrolase (beta-lactamase superfamily II)